MNIGLDGLRTPSLELQTVENARTLRATTLGVPIEHTASALEKRYGWRGSVSTVEVMQHPKAPARRDAVDRPRVIASTARGHAIKISVSRLHQTCVRDCSVPAVKFV